MLVDLLLLNPISFQAIDSKLGIVSEGFVCVTLVTAAQIPVVIGGGRRGDGASRQRALIRQTQWFPVGRGLICLSEIISRIILGRGSADLLLFTRRRLSIHGVIEVFVTQGEKGKDDHVKRHQSRKEQKFI